MLIDTWANQAIAIDFDYFALLRARAVRAWQHALITNAI